MNTLLAETAPSPHSPLRTDAELEDRVLHLIGTAGHRQLWLLFLDSDDHQLPVVIPIDDLPREPDRVETDVLVGHLASTLDQIGATQLVLVWERPGRGRLTPPDQAWARAVVSNCERRGVRLRAQLLSHTRGVTLLAPADYGRAAEVDTGAADALVRPTTASGTGGTGC